MLQIFNLFYPPNTAITSDQGSLGDAHNSLLTPSPTSTLKMSTAITQTDECLGKISENQLLQLCLDIAEVLLAAREPARKFNLIFH